MTDTRETHETPRERTLRLQTESMSEKIRELENMIKKLKDKSVPQYFEVPDMSTL